MNLTKCIEKIDQSGNEWYKMLRDTLLKTFRRLERNYLGSKLISITLSNILWSHHITIDDKYFLVASYLTGREISLHINFKVIYIASA